MPTSGVLEAIGNATGLGFLTNVTFYNSDAALNIIILIGVWSGVGYTALLLFAGMMQVPAEYYEAGAIDGASETRMFFRITLPLIRPVIALVVVVSLIGSFQVFDLVQVAPATATREPCGRRGIRSTRTSPAPRSTR